MEDRIKPVVGGYTCQFMYKGWQVSFTTQPPKEVAIFDSVENARPSYITNTVEKAIDWINAQ